MELVGEICSGLMLAWVIVGFLGDFTKQEFFTDIIQETLYIIPVVVVAWFLFAGDVTNFFDVLSLFIWGWIWYDSFKNRDDRWKRRKRTASEKVKVLASGRLAVVSK